MRQTPLLPTAEDMQHTDVVAAAFHAVALHEVGSTTTDIALSCAIRTWLRSKGHDDVPHSTIVRLLRVAYKIKKVQGNRRRTVFDVRLVA